MKLFAVVLTAFICFIATMVKPELLARNAFLDGLASHEIVSILVVILTITLASVANIHLALSRLNANLKKKGVDVEDGILAARAELSSNAWWLFGLFCIALVLLVIKGNGPELVWISAIHGGVVVIVVVNLVVLYDLYISIFELTSSEFDPAPHPGQGGEDGSEVHGYDDKN